MSATPMTNDADKNILEEERRKADFYRPRYNMFMCKECWEVMSKYHYDVDYDMCFDCADKLQDSYEEYR